MGRARVAPEAEDVGINGIVGTKHVYPPEHVALERQMQDWLRLKHFHAVRRVRLVLLPR